MKRTDLFVLISVYIISYSNGDPCKHMKCEDSSHQCRPVRACDVTGSCDMTLAACGPRDSNFNPCSHGLPVVDMSFQNVICESDIKCPVGFFCQKQRCCPVVDFEQELPICNENENSSLQPSHSDATMNLCIDFCQSDVDCRQDGQLCCVSNCSTQCRVQPYLNQPVTLTLSTMTTPTSVPLPIPAPTYFPPSTTETTADDSQLNNTSSAVTENEEVPVSDGPRRNFRKQDGVVVRKLSDSVSNPNGNVGPVRAPSINRGTEEYRPITLAPIEEIQPNNPAVNHPQKAGQCPKQPKLTICGQPPCQRDGQCPGPTKCCMTHCGLICVTPQETTDRLNRLQPNIFRDIGFGKPRAFGQFQDATNPEVFGSTFSKYGLDFALRGPRGIQQNGVPGKKFGFVPQESYAGLYKPREGPLYSYGFRPGNSNPVANSFLNNNNKGTNDNVAISFESNNKKDLNANRQGNNDEDNTILGYKLPFSNNPRPFQGYEPSRGAPSSDSSEFYANSGRSDGFTSFPGYGPNGFTDSKPGLNYGRLDPGSFGGIEQSDYEKLGLKYPGDLGDSNHKQ